MCSILEEVKAEGVEEGKAELLQRVMQKKQLTLEEAMDMLCMTEDERCRKCYTMEVM